MCGADEVAVSRRDDREVLGQQPLERVQVGAHVAVGRIDHHRRALHHVVAGEQHLRLLEQVAHVIRGVAGGVDYPQGKLTQIDALPIFDHQVWLEGRVLARGRRAAEDLRAGRRLDRCRRG